MLISKYLQKHLALKPSCVTNMSLYTECSTHAITQHLNGWRESDCLPILTLKYNTNENWDEIRSQKDGFSNQFQICTFGLLSQINKNNGQETYSTIVYITRLNIDA